MKHLLSIPCLVLALSLNWSGGGARAQEGYYLGETRLFPNAACLDCYTCPSKWAAAGAFLPVANNTALFSLFGTTFGGDGINYFAMPSPAPVTNMFWCVAAAGGIYPQRP